MPTKLTPLMAQYHELKQRHKDGILFFQVGDFYETFYEDAEEVSKLLNIALTSRDKKNPVPLAGVPVHAVEAYVGKLLKYGKKVIICDQVEDSSESKGLVKRAVTDVITPGTSLSPSTLEDKSNHYIVALKEEGAMIGFALLSISTGEFRVGCETRENIETLLSVRAVHEAVVSKDSESIREFILNVNQRCSFEEVESDSFGLKKAREELINHFETENLSGFGIEDKPLMISAAGALLSYVKSLRRDRLKHITGIRLLTSDRTLFIDRETVRNLELFEPLRGDSPQSTLINHIDLTMTSAGGRLIRSWIMRPTRDIKLIEERLNGIAAFHSDRRGLKKLREALSKFPDIERIISRVATGKAGPRELLQLLDGLRRIPHISDILKKLGSDIIIRQADLLSSRFEAAEMIESSIKEDCPATLKDGGVVKRGFDEELDRLIELSETGKRWIAGLQKTERERTGIPSLKVGFNKVFGYYIEVSNIHTGKVPENYIEKQTLVSSRRYVTSELKEKESEVISADSRRVGFEKEIFNRVCEGITSSSSELQAAARALSTLDALSSFAELALRRNYCRPEVNKSDDLIITDGRHPVVEVITKNNFISNDIVLKPDTRQVLVITGPNMGGKSTIIRQTALICILAHAGSYVPASKAEIGVMDRIFTRVGSSDNLARGESTFLVEMSETARILHNCTSKSLVLLDEVGRGTSTRDGMSIARAVTEYLLEDSGRRPKTLFATHFHELTGLADIYPRLHNMRVSIKEWNGQIIFLYRLREGKSDKSYGIHVAKLAGLPEKVIIRAREILDELERNVMREDAPEDTRRLQPSLFEESDELRNLLNEIELDRITPLEALQILAKLQKIAER